jgi:hypothetical protein
VISLIPRVPVVVAIAIVKQNTNGIDQGEAIDSKYRVFRYPGFIFQGCKTAVTLIRQRREILLC